MESMYRIRRLCLPSSFVLPSLLAAAILVPELLAQAPQPAPAQNVITGTVVSSNRNTFSVRSENGEYTVFEIDHHTYMPASLPVGAQVRVTWSPSSDPAYRLADVVTVLQVPPAAPGAKPAPAAPVQQVENLPPAVRNAQRSIEREARKWHLGLESGVALDPELIVIGGVGKFGPFFSRNMYLRGTVEFDWGEVTNLFALSPELIYNLPVMGRASRWNVYFGIGPSFQFIERSFGVDTGVNFSDFNYDAALNLLLGVQYRSGLFTEIKTSVYANPGPAFRLIVGYTF